MFHATWFSYEYDHFCTLFFVDDPCFKRNISKDRIFKHTNVWHQHIFNRMWFLFTNTVCKRKFSTKRPLVFTKCMAYSAMVHVNSIKISISSLCNNVGDYIVPLFNHSPTEIIIDKCGQEDIIAHVMRLG